MEYRKRGRALPIQSRPEVRFINCPTLEVEKEKTSKQEHTSAAIKRYKQAMKGINAF